jgi:predicted regulator of Ras-like GTPase activity (Roadblock/LC7/MglB family)
MGPIEEVARADRRARRGASGTRVERIRDVLRVLQAVSPDVLGSAVVSADGFVIASLLPSQVDEELVSGMAAALLGAG